MPLDNRWLATWQRLQEDLARVTGFSLLTYIPREGMTLADTACPPSQDNEICQLMQERYGRRANCESHCGRQILQAAQSQNPARFVCHAHLQAFAIPVVTGGQTQAVILGGKSFANYEDFAKFRELADKIGMPVEELLRLASGTPFKDSEALEQASHLAETVVQTLADHHLQRRKAEAKSVRLLTLQNVWREARAATDLGSVYELILTTIGVLFDVPSCAILLCGKEETRVTAAFGERREALLGYRFNLAQEPLEQLRKRTDPLILREATDLSRAGLPPQIGTALFLPVRSDGTLVAVLAVFDIEPSSEDIPLFQALGDYLGMLLESHLKGESLEDRERGLHLLGEIVHETGELLETEALLERLLGKVAEMVQAEQASVMILDESGELRVHATRGYSRAIVELVRVPIGEGIAGRVAATGRILVGDRIDRFDRVERQKRPRYRSGSFISVPLKVGNRTLGVLSVADRVSGGPFTDEDATILSAVGVYAAVAVDRSFYYHKSEELQRIAITDPLTGLLNRRYFQDRLAEEVERSKRHKLPLSLMMIDIDNFKGFNDTYGHPVGDEALRTTARALKGAVRTIDVAARYGGEEFAVILPQTSKADAASIADRICGEISRLGFVEGGVRVPPGRLTVSIGLAGFPFDADAPDQLLRLADLALYQAKSAGKNRVQIFHAPGA